MDQDPAKGAQTMTPALPSTLKPLLPLLGVLAVTAALPLIGAMLGGLPVSEFLRLPLHARAWDPLPPNTLFTVALDAVTLALLAVVIYFAWPRRPAGGRLDAPASGRWPRFSWLALFALLLAIISVDGTAANAGIGLVILALTILANADTERRTGSSLMSRRPGYFGSLFLASLVAGWLFHWLNLFLQLWTYPPAAEAIPFVLGKSLDYAVLLPALLSLRQWLASFPAVLGAVTRAELLDETAAAPQEGWALMALALLALAGAALWPDWIYPLSLSAPLIIAVAMQQVRRRPTPLAGIADGDWSRLLLPAAAALLLGLLTQGLNQLLGPAWSFHTPLLGGPALLGLPLPCWIWIGLLGPFGVWLGDQLTEPWKQRPQQPPPRTRFPVRVQFGGKS
jgi:hypothetical protein